MLSSSTFFRLFAEKAVIFVDLLGRRRRRSFHAPYKSKGNMEPASSRMVIF